MMNFKQSSTRTVFSFAYTLFLENYESYDTETLLQHCLSTYV